MSVIVLLIVAGGLVAGSFLVLFLVAVRKGQFDDMTTPPLRMLTQDPTGPGLKVRRTASHAATAAHVPNADSRPSREGVAHP